MAAAAAAPEENKKHKNADVDAAAPEEKNVDAFADAQENLDTENMDLDASTGDNSSTTGSEADSKKNAAFVSDMYKFMEKMNKGMDDNAATIGKNQAGINDVSKQVGDLKKDVSKQVGELKTNLEKTDERLHSTCQNVALLAKQILTMEQNLANPARAPAPHFQLSPRADPRGIDPLSNNDAWAKGRAAAGGTACFVQQAQTSASAAAWQEIMGTTPRPPATNPYQLEPKQGDRNTLIFGGFQQDTDKSDIEETLRDILAGTAGVERITSLGKYASCGKVTFKDKELMWDFIRAHKGMKFPYRGQQRALWFSIERTDGQREDARKVALMVRALVGHLVDVGKVEPEVARASIEADYVRGVLVFREEAPVLTRSEDTLIIVRGPKPLAIRIIQKDKDTGEYGVMDAGRGRDEFKTFGWEALMVEVTESKVKARW